MQDKTTKKTFKSIKMATSKFDKKPEPGDLIEIFRGNYQHWAIYVGEGYVIHLAPPSEYAGAGARSMMSVMCDQALVKKELLSDVVGNDRYEINNLLDEKYEPLPISVILKEAHSYVGKVLSYCVARANCEHFVTVLRYGKAESRQVRTVVNVTAGVGLLTVLAFGAAAVYSSLTDSKDKEKSKE